MKWHTFLSVEVILHLFLCALTGSLAIGNTLVVYVSLFCNAEQFTDVVDSHPRLSVPPSGCLISSNRCSIFKHFFKLILLIPSGCYWVCVLRCAIFLYLTIVIRLRLMLLFLQLYHWLSVLSYQNIFLWGHVLKSSIWIRVVAFNNWTSDTYNNKLIRYRS